MAIGTRRSPCVPVCTHRYPYAPVEKKVMEDKEKRQKIVEILLEYMNLTGKFSQSDIICIFSNYLIRIGVSYAFVQYLKHEMEKIKEEETDEEDIS